MSLDYLNDIRVQIGAFVGDAPAETISLWQSLIAVPIQVHLEPATGIKTYLVNDFPAEKNSFEYADALVAAGIVGAHSVHLVEGDRLREGWSGFKIIGPEVTVLSGVVA
jgi:hypothetical protein